MTAMPPRLPLHDLHVAAGAVVDAACGLELPFSYGDVAGEYRAVRTAAGVIDRTLHDLVEVTGKDRISFLHAMLTNDIKQLTPGTGCGAAFLDVHGKVQFIVTVLVFEDRVLMLAPPGSSTKLMELFDRFLFSEKAYVRDASDEHTILMTAGPAASELLAKLTGAAAPVRPWAHVAGTIASVPVHVVRGAGETGEEEFWVLGPRADGGALWQALVVAGARPVGVTAVDVLRVESGAPSPGHDVDDSVLLPEIPSAALVSHTKGCYIGQEVVVRIRDRGHVNRRLTGLTLEGDVVPAPGSALLADGKNVGRVTSAVRSLTLGRPIALAFVRREYAAGAAVTVKDGVEELSAIVTAPPFVTGSLERAAS
jgi:folate-binding protein YgfZ